MPLAFCSAGSSKLVSRSVLSCVKLALFLALALPLLAHTNTASAQSSTDRTVLPPAAPAYKGKIGQTYKDSTPDWGPALPLKAPPGAPNVLIVVLDDVGFGHLGAYGGPIETPNINKLANGGLKYTDFHTTALCSPSRGALLTGRNHHSIGLAAITEAATGYPGNFGNIPKSAATIAEVLKQNGYNTFAFGKWHLAPYTAYTAAGPFDRWPLGMGFERFYGFLGGETDQWAPLLVEDNHFIETPRRPGYHLSEDLVDKTIALIRDQQQANTGRPFFAYLAFGAAHAPLHAPRSYIDKYRGRFDSGWDAVRQETYERQKQMGVIPKNTVLPPRNPGIQAWNELTPDQKKLYARMQEVFAGFVDHTDEQIGRLLTALDEMKIRDNTLVILVSDNGASQEGLRDGVTNTDRYRNYFPEPVDEMLQHIEKLGGPETDPHYPMGWAMAGNSPLKRWKQDTHSGGNTDPFIISWPARIKPTLNVRRQYHHLVDVVPTILEATGIPAPTAVNGVQQMPLAGISMNYAFDEPDATRRRKVQYYEMLGSRAIWSDGWAAVAWHKAGTSWDDDIWELYHTDVDFSQAKDLAAAQPDKLKELKDLWWEEAKRYGVLPLDDRRYERTADPSRPSAADPRTSYTYYPKTSVVHPLAGAQLNGRPHTVTAEVTIPEGGAEGVLVSTGGEFGGWTIFVKDGKLNYAHNYLKVAEYAVASPEPISPGPHRLGFRYLPKSSSLKPDVFIGDLELLVDDVKVGEVKNVKSAGQYSAMTGYGLSIGRNIGTPVSHAYEAPFSFTGTIDRVTINILE